MHEISSAYNYGSTEPSWSNHYLWPPLVRMLQSRLQPGAKILDVGCGSGATAGMLHKLGFAVIGVDPSDSGIKLAQADFSDIIFAQRSAYDDLEKEFGQFDAVVSLEVVEHCFSPRAYARNIAAAIRPGGFAVISTPFHGYWKNLALALTNKFDFHWSPLWDGGHIKFWSEKTISALLTETGFTNIAIERVGRIPPLAKSMLISATRPVAG